MKTQRLNDPVRALMLCAALTVLLAGCLEQKAAPEENRSEPAETIPSSSSSSTASSAGASAPAKTAATSEEAGTAQSASSAAPQAAPSSGLANGKNCTSDGQCRSGCCSSSGTRMRCSVAGSCELRDMSVDECYKKGYNMCLGTCQKASCGDCAGIMRCVEVEEGGKTVLKVEYAKTAGNQDSCEYSGEYLNAGGAGGYCDLHEGKMVYAKCGSQATGEDCVKAYTETVVYFIAQKRSFHAQGGDEGDLWCFSCEKAGL